MFSLTNGLKEDNRNCIKLHYNKSLKRKKFYQYNSNGSIIFTYKESDEIIGVEKFIVYDVNERIIGSIEGKIAFNQIFYTLYDENNKIIIIIEHNNGSNTCCSSTFNYYDSNKNIENILIMKNACCSTIYELYDKYNTLTNRAELFINGRNSYLNEYDLNNSNRIFRIELNPFKIFENDNEVDLNNKTLFNNGFSKLQIFFILGLLFRHHYDDNMRNFA